MPSINTFTTFDPPETTFNFIRSIGDFNGDGFDDIAFNTADDDGERAVNIHFGSAMGLSQTANVIIINSEEGRDANLVIDENIFLFADVNNDGLDDIIITDRTPFSSGDHFVVYGTVAANQTIDINSLTENDGLSIVNAGTITVGDVNNDGFNDLVLSASGPFTDNQIIFGALSGFGSIIDVSDPESTNLQFQTFSRDFDSIIIAVGDTNGNGFDDIAIGMPSARSLDGNTQPNSLFGNRAGEVSVLSFGPTNIIFGPAFEIISIFGTQGDRFVEFNGDLFIGGGERLGETIRAVGDVNGDGLDDFIVSAPGSAGGGNFPLVGDFLIMPMPRPSSVTPELISLVSAGMQLRVPLGVRFGQIDLDPEVDILSVRGAKAIGDINGDGIDELFIDGVILSATEGFGEVEQIQFNGDEASGGDTNDLIFGGGGADTIFGNAGDDSIVGGQGRDILEGGSGNDFLDGGTNLDIAKGGSGDDTLIGASGADTLLGGLGNDFIEGGAGFDSLVGSAGDDTINGGIGADILRGSNGNDVLNGNSNLDTVFGGAGNDTIFGESGNDLLFGNSGDDLIDAGSGFDRIESGTGDDIVSGGDLADNIFGDAGDDVLNGDQGADRIFAGADNDTLNGGLNDDALFGQFGNDLLNGDNGNDRLFGNAGFDTLNGGTGDDVLSGGFNADFFIFTDGFGNDVITDFNQANIFETIDLSGVTQITSFDDLSANHLSNDVDGNAVITDGTNTITLTGIDMADLVASDFVF